VLYAHFGQNSHSSTLIMVAANSSYTFVNIFWTTRHHIHGDIGVATSNTALYSRIVGNPVPTMRLVFDK
jgi:hypothetical protein